MSSSVPSILLLSILPWRLADSRLCSPKGPGLGQASSTCQLSASALVQTKDIWSGVDDEQDFMTVDGTSLFLLGLLPIHWLPSSSWSSVHPLISYCSSPLCFYSSHLPPHLSCDLSHGRHLSMSMFAFSFLFKLLHNLNRGAEGGRCFRNQLVGSFPNS